MPRTLFVTPNRPGSHTVEVFVRDGEELPATLAVILLEPKYGVMKPVPGFNYDLVIKLFTERTQSQCPQAARMLASQVPADGDRTVVLAAGDRDSKYTGGYVVERVTIDGVTYLKKVERLDPKKV